MLSEGGKIGAISDAGYNPTYPWKPQEVQGPLKFEEEDPPGVSTMEYDWANKNVGVIPKIKIHASFLKGLYKYFNFIWRDGISDQVKFDRGVM